MKLFRVYCFFLSILLIAGSLVIGQTIGSSLPVNVAVNGKYLFYQHAGVVTELGNNAINQSVPEWGPYEYFNILDSLNKQGFTVISEIRTKGVDDSVYFDKISKQIDSLLLRGVKPAQIVVVGASSGWGITLGVSSKLKNGKIKFVMLGGCKSDYYLDYVHTELYGQFLSIIEYSDPHGSCEMIFKQRSYVSNFREIVLHTGLSHGFLYQGRKEWIRPLVEWFNAGKK